MVRKFKLINEKGQEYSLMDINQYTLITDVSGLGISYSTEYVKIGNTFVVNSRQLDQAKPGGTVNFISYDNYYKFVKFIINSTNLKLFYKIPSKSGNREFLRDVNIQLLDKTEKKTNGIISESIVFDTLSLWYEENTITYTIEPLSDELRWDFTWDSIFNDNSSQSINYQNRGHIEAPILLEVEGAVSNVIIDIYIDNELVQNVKFKTNILKYEKLVYNSKENEFSIKKIKTDGTEENLFDLDVIDFENNNVIRIPSNKTCEIRLSADSTIENAKLVIYPQYLCV